ncbi:DUF2959 domain-containing protein [soil metagenome]
MPFKSRISLGFVLIAGIFLSGCQSIYYSAMEKLGTEKRDILVSRVKAGRDDQEKAKEQFKDALEQFKATVKTDGGSLEAKYNTLSSGYERSKDRADAVNERIKSIESVSEDLFSEWKSELKQYKDPSLRRSSEKQLDATRDRYEQLIGKMKAAASKMTPILESFHDQVLYLKHNLNASAIASLDNERITLEKDIDALVKEMEDSINEANAFIAHMGTTS